MGVGIYHLLHDMETAFGSVNSQLHMGIRYEILVMPRKLQTAVFQASLIFQLRFHDDVLYIRLCIIDTFTFVHSVHLTK